MCKGKRKQHAHDACVLAHVTQMDIKIPSYLRIFTLSDVMIHLVPGCTDISGRVLCIPAIMVTDCSVSCLVRTEPAGVHLSPAAELDMSESS